MSKTTKTEEKKRGRGRPAKTAGELRVEVTVAMGVTFEERARLKLEAVQRKTSMSNNLRGKCGLPPIKQKPAAET